jgi:SAM-dependent methyltransferase
VCAVIAVRTPPMETTSVSGASETSPSWRQRAVWIAFAFVPAAAVLGTTQALTTDVASVPLLWVLPLAIYLVTFVLAFAGKTRVPTRAAFGVVAVLVLGVAASQWNTQRPDPRVALPLYLATLFAIGLLGHGRLAEQRPPVRDLTDFYLSIAAGGALGSVFCGLVAPLIFSSVAEYPLVLVLGCLLGIRLGPRQAGRRGRVVDLMLPLASAGLLAVALVAAGATNPVAGDDRLTVRTFFGVLRVKDKPGPPFSPKAGPNAGQEVRLPMHELFHGTTLHGVQVTRPSQARLPTSYYHPSGPIGRVFAALRAGPESGLLSDVGVVGLGVGSLAAYAAAGERFTFFEIDPAVVRIARDPELFSYLRDCAGRAEVVVEDGRIALAREPDGRFGLLVIDAFSSDAVPVHLLTREALALVLDKLRPGGLAAFHVSSSFFDLAPVLAEAAADLGKEGLYWFDTEISPVEVVTAKEASRWVIVAREPAALALLAGSGSWMPLASVRRTEGGPWLWTDRYSSPLAALRR